MPDNLAAQEARLDELIQSGQTESAVRLLCQLAVACAKKNHFEKADAFRDRMYEVDSMALASILKVNEVIEGEKSRALTPDRRQLWSRFFQGLSTEEANAFFFALKELSLEGEQVLLHQGTTNDRLYLVNQGQLKIVHEGENRQILIHSLGAGDTCGEDTFFSINVCTASVKALTKTSLCYLERERLEGLKIQFPLLGENLKKICRSGGRMYDWLRRKGLDRRKFKRFNFQTAAWFQVLTPGSTAVMQQPVAAELWDLSKTGLSFYFQSKNAQALSRLVGKTLGVTFNLTIDGRQKEVALTGVVQGVQVHPLDEYSVHVKLTRNFSDQAINTIRSIAEQK
jgi:hypothetical protein